MCDVYDVRRDVIMDVEIKRVRDGGGWLGERIYLIDYR